MGYYVPKRIIIGYTQNASTPRMPPSATEYREMERFAAVREEQERAYNVRWLNAFESKPVSDISDDDLGDFYKKVRPLRNAKTEEQKVANRAVFRFYTTLLARGQVEDVAQNLTWDVLEHDTFPKIVPKYCFIEVLKLVATRDSETLDLHQPLVQQLVRYTPFSRQGPEMPKPVARTVLHMLPESVIGGVSQRRAALRMWVSDEERRMAAASTSLTRWDTAFVCSIMAGVPDREFPQPLAKAFGGRGRARYTAMLIQNLAPECESLSAFNKLCDHWNHVPSAKDVVLALQATELNRDNRRGLIFFDRSLEVVQQTINRIPTETGRQQVRDVVASALIRESRYSAETDRICQIFNHQRTLGDVSSYVHGLINRRAQAEKAAVRDMAEAYRCSVM